MSKMICLSGIFGSAVLGSLDLGRLASIATIFSGIMCGLYYLHLYLGAKLDTILVGIRAYPQLRADVDEHRDALAKMERRGERFARYVHARLDRIARALHCPALRPKDVHK
jgi:hypothetical protein